MTTVSESARRALEAWVLRDRPPASYEFPHRAVVGAVRAHGINRLPHALNDLLVHTWEQARKRDPEPGGAEWVTTLWLECLTSRARGAPSYGTYTMTTLLERWCRLGDLPDRLTRISALLAADMIRHELRRGLREGDDGRRRSLLVAATRFARGLTPAPGWTGARDDVSPESPPEAVRRCNRLLSGDGAGLPPTLALLVEGTVPVATLEPDEPLFLRSVQVMELLAVLAAEYAAAAHEAALASEPDPHALEASLAGITDALAHARRCFRLVALIDPGQFAAIRAATAGTGALQSEGFAHLERRCRGTAGVRAETVGAVGLDTVPAPAPSLGDTLRAAPPDERRRRGVEAVNEQWARWKHTHYGVAKRIIGDVPGTGGTDGVRYLARHLKEPLL